MEKINPEKAYDLFIEHSKKNPSTWIDRSMKVAEVAKRIAKAIRTR